MTTSRSNLNDSERGAVSRWKPYVVKTTLKRFLKEGLLFPTLHTLSENEEGFFVPEEKDLQNEISYDFPLIELVIPSIRDHVVNQESICVCLTSVIVGRMLKGKKTGNNVSYEEERSEKLLILHFETKNRKRKDIRVYCVREEWDPAQLEYLPHFSGNIEGLPTLMP